MKLMFLTSLLLMCLAATARAQQQVDGPYVSYSGDQIHVVTITLDDDLLQPVITRYDTDRKDNVVLKVVPQGEPKMAFTVKLRPVITNDPASYPAADKTLFMSDIEGEFVAFRKMLLVARVIDAAYHWTYGRGALVIPGDLFDRGRDVVAELWLLYKLEDEARAAGGSVQVVLGNHDIMNLSGDHRYTDAKYFKATWLMGTGIDSLFNRNTELGRWLRSKNLIEKSGDVLVMHGGMSPVILQKHLSLEQLNAPCMPEYDISREKIPSGLQLEFGNSALFWYRGYFKDPKTTMEQVDSTLAQYHCKYIVVGHTIVKWNIASFYGGKVIGVDVDEHKGKTQAALYEAGKWYVLNGLGHKKPLIYKAANDRVSEKDIL